MGYGIDPGHAPVTRIALLAALVDGDLDTAYRVATTLLDEGVPFEALVAEVLGPVQRDLGARWADGDLSVADEHAATAAAENLVVLLAGGLAPSDGPLVVVACPEGDAHSLPARVVTAVLAMRGFRSVLLGGSLPAIDLGDYLERQEPIAVALSISMPAALYRSVASVAVAHDRGIPVVVGGRAVGDEALARRLGADAWAETADGAGDVLDDWRTRPPRWLAARVTIPAECRVIDVHRASLLAAAVPPDEPEAGRDLVDDVSRLLDVLQGALLLDAPALLIAHLEMLRAIRTGHGTSHEALARVLDRLVTATHGPLPASAALLRVVA
ncbi:MAG: cobalamin B12-binding domain-containing protein [Acidimicrobiia bacterium]